MSKFKIEDFKVGDKTSIAGVVKEVDVNDETILVEYGADSYVAWFNLGAITTHERALKIGDSVVDVSEHGGRERVSVIGVDGDQLWLKDDEGYRWHDYAKDFKIVS